MFSTLPNWMQYLIAALLIVLSYILTGRYLARALYSIVGETQTTYDDIVVKRIRPRRLALLAPLAAIFIFAYLIPNPETQETVRKAVLVIGLWLVILTASGLMDAVNDIYEGRREFSGASIKGYFDLLTILLLGAGIITSISIITGDSPLVLLAGLGAIMAVLLLIFRDTILSLVASVQISTNDLVKEGDWLEVPSFDADGEVVDMSLHQIKILNGDKTISYVPTYKLTEVAYKNYRGISESGGRRIKRALYIDERTIRFCDTDDVARLREIDLIHDFVISRTDEPGPAGLTATENGSALAVIRQLTNIGAFRAYVQAYLHCHPHIRQDMPLVVRELAPSPEGLPLEIYAFTDTVEWVAYENIQAEIFDHLLAVLPHFDLRIFQQPSGHDFARFLANR
ncbi:MAG: mechanosensitive ion channel family protein [Candidatus Promineifilaceae bacterium]